MNAIPSRIYICCVNISSRQKRSIIMAVNYTVSLVVIFVVNILFFFSGICLNSLVIVSFWRSVQLRKKLCYFTIMILSCCDLLVVLTNHSLSAVMAILWLTGRLNGLYPRWLVACLRLSHIFVAISLLAIFVMNFDRYLATHYPIFHRTSVTKGKLLALLVVMIIGMLIMMLMSINDAIIPYQLSLLIFFSIIFLSVLFINYKLVSIARKRRINRTLSAPHVKSSFSLENVSCCVLAVACFVVLSIPAFIYIGQRMSSDEKESTLSNGYHAGLWGQTISSTNSTFNCLIFFWKNKTLRNQGLNVITGMNKCRRVQS